MRKLVLLVSIFFFIFTPFSILAEETCNCNASSPGQCPEEDDDDPYDVYEEQNASGSLSRNVLAPLTPLDLGQSDYSSIADIVDPYELPDGAMQVVLFESSHDLSVEDRFRILAFYFSHGPEYAATFVPVPFEGIYDPDNEDADEFGYVYQTSTIRRIFERLLEYPGSGGGLDSINWTNFQNADIILALSSDAMSNLIQERFRQQDARRSTQGDSTVRFGDSYGARAVATLLASHDVPEQSVAYRTSDKFWDWFDDTLRWCLGNKKKKKKKKDDDKPKNDDDDFDDDQDDLNDDDEPIDDDFDDDDPLHCPDANDTLPAEGFDEVIDTPTGPVGIYTDRNGKKKMCPVPPAWQ